jgi:nucleoside-diphosphate-sugar epimerase
VKSTLSIAEKDVGYPKQHLDTYTTTKEAAEHLVLSANDPSGQGLATCVLRPAGVFGKGDKLGSDKLVLGGSDSIILGDGTAIIDWVPVECVASAHQLAEAALSTEQGRKKVNGQVYFIGNNENKSYGWFNGDISKIKNNCLIGNINNRIIYLSG